MQNANVMFVSPPVLSPKLLDGYWINLVFNVCTRI